MLPQQGNIRVYGAGGFGVNIASHFDVDDGVTAAGFAILNVAYLDTSRSNLNETLRDENIYIVEAGLDEVDGSGKVRRTNHPVIAKSVKQMLQKHAPKDFNIVVFSASGGSGSVIGPLVVAELLERGLPTVAIVVGSDESKITTDNTFNTLQTLDNIARKRDVPVVMLYEHNDRNKKFSEVDKVCKSTIGSLAILCSRQNHAVDTQDIRNWVQFNKSTEVPAQLALLDVYHTNEEVEANSQPVSIASLYKDRDIARLNASPDYICEGYPRTEIKDLQQLHFSVTLSGVPVLVKSISDRVSEFQKLQDSRVATKSFVNDDKLSDDGLMVL